MRSNKALKHTSSTPHPRPGLRLDVGYALGAALDTLHDASFANVLHVCEANVSDYSTLKKRDQTYVTAADLGVVIQIPS